MTGGVYKLTDRITGETLWIGQSVDIERRHHRHLRDLRNGVHSQQSFSDWYRESNRTSEDILMETLAICAPEEMNEIEGFWFEQDPPRFYGQMPSPSRKWYLSAETRAKISKTHSEKIRLAKENGTYVSVWSGLSEEARLRQTFKNREVGFTSVSAAEAARLGNKDRPKSAEQRRKASEAAKSAAKEILICVECGRECKGKSALGRHMTVHS